MGLKFNLITLVVWGGALCRVPQLRLVLKMLFLHLFIEGGKQRVREVKGQLARISSLHPPRGFWGLNLGCQT